MILESADGGRVLALAQREFHRQLESARRGSGHGDGLQRVHQVLIAHEFSLRDVDRGILPARGRGCRLGTRPAHTGTSCVDTRPRVGKRALSGMFRSIETRGEFGPGG